MEEIAVYTTSEVAKRAHVDNSTVRLWVKTGKLQPSLKTIGGHYRFDAHVVDALLAPPAPVDSASPHAGSAGVSSREDGAS